MADKAVSQQKMYDDDALRNVRSFDDAVALLASSGVTPVDVTDYGTGFDVIDKQRLVDNPFVILEYKFAKGDFGEEFAIAYVVTESGEKGILTDGGTGVCKQLQSLAAQNVWNGIVCRKGLDRSDYEHVDENGKRTPATTYYLAGM